MPSDEAYALEVTPESALQFTLTRNPAPSGESSSSDAGVTRCTMTLRHPGKTNEYLAFKVKTTQPRRYLVRPNQGIVAPNSTETVSILLVEKDKQILLQSYERLGQSALDHSKDKFLVQSCAAPDDFATQYNKEKGKTDAGSDGYKTSKEMAEKLTSLWEKTSSSGETPVYNKKLHVRHVVMETKPTASASQVPAARTDKTPVENMSPEQMFAEVSSLRRKYDELVAFSVNLTAERDILNNTLEQTKRDLNRETAAKKALESSDPGDRTRGGISQKGDSGGFGLSILQVLVVAIACFLAGIKACNSDSVDFLENVPYLGDLLGMAGDDAVVVEPIVDTGVDPVPEIDVDPPVMEG
mmetsp:Transcript_19454/g.26709  ORF Transcript_19454/g.26709 Transcript_19454/m.26709 type:complete len:355 (-) Transcript_19454:390-1454(-)|eukprot:CAMPEP_0185730404 /NCGR_PEP_ID=MMETSP1171-20130828/9729_1 /TAXON_ID=374046 /ORGANISM="Helicotheca tamensis, Strain CCMP826" /LENGTH=354 /DNA_ID=CAMNT_0028399435 /DNA_START=70 /DNA_END=1134 /DNA_ORIENTATION=-